MDVILKDLSDTGFAFVVDHEIEDATGLSCVWYLRILTEIMI